MVRKLNILIIFLFSFSFAYSQDDFNEYMTAISDIHYKRYEKVEKELLNLILNDNSNANYYMTLGECFFIQGKYEQAAKLYKSAMNNKKKKAIYKIAECYSKIDSTDKAIEYLKIYLKTKDKLLQSEIKLNPNFKNIENSKAWHSLWKTEFYNKTEKKLSEAKYLISKEDYVNAFDILDKLIIQNNRRHRAYEMRGDLLMIKGEFKNATNSYIKASEIKVRNSFYKEKIAKAYFKDKNYKKSLKFCNEAIKENPYNETTYLLKAQNLLFLKKYNRSKDITDLILKYYPDNDEALNIAGLCLYNKKDYIKALEKYNVLLSDNEHVKTLQAKSPKPDYYINRADAYMAVSMYENVIKDLSMALDLNPKLPEVYYKRGIAKVKANKKVEACYDFKFAYSKGYYKASDMLLKYCR